MASFKASMLAALPLYHLILLLLFTSSHHISKPVFADNRLIELQCHNAQVPAVCIQCLKSDPQGEVVSDNVGIATIVLKCLSNNAETLAKNMSSLASGVQDKNIKSLLQDCEQGFSQAKHDLSTATDQLKRKDYDKTNHSVRTALEQEVTCNKNVLSLKLRVPNHVLFEMRVYEDLSEAAMRIIDRF
ncbi:PREDICTED: pectinesterase inhibitor [Theobroma cacao]|uniref:Pectinesterase inhibitor n=2 Tax=Theobroma cacao TaxID=3641 RepID=A0AB32WJY3_THECC|nr:PREDICTED: pectinesterase inhibitor [Theobroma cacao]EOY13873.1 Plant invertase/pectin methylesterase inhibitor superfamily protein, putative [Theobroma cacao]